MCAYVRVCVLDDKAIESEVVVSREEVLTMLELYPHTSPGHISLQDVLKDMDPSGVRAHQHQPNDTDRILTIIIIFLHEKHSLG